MQFSPRMLNRNIRTIAGASLTTSFQNVGAVTTIVGYKIAIVNATTTDVQITDGSAADAWYLPAGSTLSVGEGLTSPGQQSDAQASTIKGCQFQAKLPSGAAGTGTLVITIEGH
jgi:hypothetical protein